MSDASEPRPFRSFDTPQVKRYLASRAYRETEKFVHSRNARAFEGVPPDPDTRYAFQSKQPSSVVIGQHLAYQGPQNIWPTWGVCKTPALLQR